MARLIDADSIKWENDPEGNEICNKVLFLRRSNGKFIEVVKYALKQIINNAPTVDAQPVVHGRWIEKDDGVMHCDQCDRVGNPHIDNYCPNCGAKMDGGDTNV